MIKEYDYVFVKDGSKGTVVDMSSDHEKFLLELSNDSETEIKGYSVSDVLAVWKESEKSFVSFVFENNRAIA
ncbi:MAG: hypothetical protein LBV19_07670 [Streptococcaceae bacterium]|jgi:hypothetical protein|nr:hypothetical protein [Streptococcaceae bacterium]